MPLLLRGLFGVDERIAVRAKGAHLMPEYLLTAPTCINLCVKEALLPVECHLILTVGQHRWRELATIQILDNYVKRMAIVINVEEKRRVVRLRVYLEEMQRIAVAGLEYCLHALHEFFDNRVTAVIAIQLNEVTHMKDHLLWELLAHPLPLSLFPLILRIK